MNRDTERSDPEQGLHGDDQDHGLMLAVKSGDTACLATLFEKYHRRLYNFFLQFCGNRHRAEDMVQDTFVRILKYAGSYSESGTFAPWLFHIARNVAAATYQQEKRRVDEDGAVDPDQTVTWLTDPQYLQEIESRHQRLQMALLKMPHEKRELVLLGKMQMLSMNDLAELFGCTRGAVKVRLHRALELLKQLYESDSHSDGKISHEMRNN